MNWSTTLSKYKLFKVNICSSHNYYFVPQPTKFLLHTVSIQFNSRSHYRCIQFKCSCAAPLSTHHLRVDISGGDGPPWHRPRQVGL